MTLSPLTVADVVAATSARVVRLGRTAIENGLGSVDLQRTISGVTTDSRAVPDDALFVALRGEHTDGHGFVGAALEAGARAALVELPLDPERVVDLPSGAAAPLVAPKPRYLFRVPDTLTALQSLATYRRDQAAIDVVGITGSIGKTTTKEIVAAVLARDRPTLKNVGNLNTEIGLPLTLLGLRAEHRAAVLEMGMYAPGDIALLASVARPRIGIVTTVAPIHLERLRTIERIARAKSELVAALPADGLAILNGDNRWTRAMARTSGIARSLLVGLSDDCDYRATNVQSHGLEGTIFMVRAEGEEIAMRTRIPGAHLVPSFLAAAAAARELGMGWPAIVQAVSQATLDVRQRLIRDRPGLLIIDDSYNASPLSMIAALDLLRMAPGTHIAVLGDMLELGSEEEAAHREVGAKAAEAADWLVVRGARASWIADGARARGLSEERIVHVETNAEAAERVARLVGVPRPVATASRPARTISSSRGDGARHAGSDWSVLVKGSRGMAMEEIVERLRGEA